MAARKPTAIPADPPDRLSEEAAEIWRDVVARGAIAPVVDAVMLEAYCELVVRWRDAAKRIADEGLVVDGGRTPIVHPAVAAERQLSDQLRAWAPLINKPAAPRRRSGPMYDATRRSIAASTDLQHNRYAGACEAVLTLAWVIDEAQREGLEALRKVSYTVIPSYLKGCAELQITPASLPDDVRKGTVKGGKVTKFADAAEARRAKQQVAS